MLIYFCYLLLLVFFIKLSKTYSFFNKIIVSTLLFSFIIVVVVEILSLFKSLNFLSISVFWTVFGFSLLIYFFVKKASFIKSIIDFKLFTINFFKSKSILEKLLIFVIILLLFLLFLQGLLYPPNNWDSLTYHMSRIVYWLSNETVDHYKTHIIRQLYQPPFAEYFILNINILNGNDYLSNSVQLFFLINTLVVVYEILMMLKVSTVNRLLTLLFIIVIPCVTLQATNTKNDIVVTFFVLTCLFYCYKCYEKVSLNNFLLLGSSAGLAIFTKGTAYLFLAPILLLFSFFMIQKLIRSKNTSIVKFGFLAFLLAFSINARHYYRNYDINGSLLNIDNYEASSFSNDKMNLKNFTSSAIKNIGLHLGYPINLSSDFYIRKLHEKLNVDIDDKKLNYLDCQYSAPEELTTHEDYVPNTLAFFIVLISILLILSYLIFKSKNVNKNYALLILILLLQIGLFVGVLKWQPWHTRLHIPMFILGSILVGGAMQVFNLFKKSIIMLTPLFIFSFCFYCFYNNLRPIIKNNKYTKSMSITDSRFKKYFANQPLLYKEYGQVNNLLVATNPKKIGLELNDWEYPLLCGFYYEKIQLVSVNVFNVTSKIIQNENNIDVIVSSRNEPFISLGSKKFSNQTLKNSYVFLYK